MFWFIVSRTTALVWEEWSRREKQEKTFTMFWASVIIYLIGLAVFHVNHPFSINTDDLTSLVSAVQCTVIVMFAGPFIFAGISFALYFLVNVIWCISSPFTGIWRLLDEEEKVSGRLILKVRKKIRGEGKLFVAKSLLENLLCIYTLNSPLLRLVVS